MCFLAGHPASGKTTILKFVLEKLQSLNMYYVQIDDRSYFLETVKKDNNNLLHKLRDDGSIQIIDEKKFYKNMFEAINNELLELSEKNKLIFLEFTCNYLPIVFSSLNSKLFEDSMLILMLTSLKLANKRNATREFNSADIYNQRIPDDYVKSCYQQNYKIENISKLFKNKYLINNIYDLAFLDKESQKIIKKIKEIMRV